MAAKRHEIAQQAGAIDARPAIGDRHRREVRLAGDRTHRPEQIGAQRLGRPRRPTRPAPPDRARSARRPAAARRGSRLPSREAQAGNGAGNVSVDAHRCAPVAASDRARSSRRRRSASAKRVCANEPRYSFTDFDSTIAGEVAGTSKVRSRWPACRARRARSARRPSSDRRRRRAARRRCRSRALRRTRHGEQQRRRRRHPDTSVRMAERRTRRVSSCGSSGHGRSRAARDPLTRSMRAPSAAELLLDALVAAVEVVDAVDRRSRPRRRGRRARGTPRRAGRWPSPAAPVSCAAPRTIAVLPSTSMSAPMRRSSGTCMKRFSKIVSVMTAVPSARASSAP